MYRLPGSSSGHEYQAHPPIQQPRPNGSPWERPSPGTLGTAAVTPINIWREHTTSDGRKYWYNTLTRQSTWEKPAELLTPEEKALMNCPWKEYKTPDGKTYYSNIQTKESKWVMPDEYKDLYEKAQLAKQRPAPEATPSPGAGTVTVPALQHQYDMEARPQRHYRPPPPSATLISQAPPVEFSTKEEAEKAFFKLLRETGVRSDWTWEQTMRAIITNPMYRALKTTAERKAAFQAFIDREAKREREIREEKESKQRIAFFHMLENTKEIKPYSRYHTALRMLGQHPAFLQVKPESQREVYFAEYVQGLQRREKERLRELRKSSMESFSDLLRKIPEITFETRWKEAQLIYSSRPEFQDSRAFEGMDITDFLTVFEKHSHSLWEKPLQEQAQRATEKRRTERKAREGFRELLNELVQQKKINASTMWKEVYPLMKDDPRYKNLLGIPESTPIDLFWDLLESLEDKLYEDKKMIYDVLKEQNFEVLVDTSYDDYYAALCRNERIIRSLSQGNIELVFEHLQSKAVHRLKDEKKRQERRIKRKIDALRHAIKHLQPPIKVDDTWESVKPRLEQLPEFNALDTEALQKEAFEKHIQRLKDKLEQDDEDEEGMIREDEDANAAPGRRQRSQSRSARRHRSYYSRRGSDRESDYGGGYSDEERLQRRKRRRRVPTDPDIVDNLYEGNRSSAEEGEALDAYEKMQSRA